VCEDTIFNCKLLEKVFENTIVNLDFAENGKVGLNKFEKKKDYDLILLDLQMPVMDGFELAKILRLEKNSDIHIIALTATNSEFEKSRCFEIGMNNYFTKPFKQKELFDGIIKLFQKKFNTNLTFNEFKKKSNSFFDKLKENNNFPQRNSSKFKKKNNKDEKNENKYPKLIKEEFFDENTLSFESDSFKKNNKEGLKDLKHIISPFLFPELEKNKKETSLTGSKMCFKDKKMI